MKITLLAAAVALCLPAGGAVGQGTNPKPAALSPALLKGRDNAVKYCTACHLLPEPELLTKTVFGNCSASATPGSLYSKP